MAIITLIIQNNFYTNSSSNINETTHSDIEKVAKKSIQSNIPNKDENPVSIENEKIIDEIKDNKTKDQKNEITEVNKIEKSDEELEKILKEKEDKVKENSKSNKPLEIEKEIPNYIAIILAKIISDEKIDSKNIQLDSYEKTTWNSSSLGCPKNDMSYAQVMTDGYKLLFLSNNKMTEYHTDLRENYINCTENKCNKKISMESSIKGVEMGACAPTNYRCPPRCPPTKKIMHTYFLICQYRACVNTLLPTNIMLMHC